MEIITPEERIKQLRELENKEIHTRQQAARTAWISVALAAIVLAGLIYMAMRKLSDLNAKVEQKRSELAAVQMKIDNLQVLAGRALDSRSNPEAAVKELADKLPGRVYLQIIDEGDRPRANQISTHLHDAGYIPLGVECVAGVSNLKTADVRYYDDADKDRATRLAETVKKSGEPEVAVVPLHKDKDPRFHPNVFELWLPHRDAASTPCRSMMKP